MARAEAVERQDMEGTAKGRNRPKERKIPEMALSAGCCCHGPFGSPFNDVTEREVVEAHADTALSVSCVLPCPHAGVDTHLGYS